MYCSRWMKSFPTIWIVLSTCYLVYAPHIQLLFILIPVTEIYKLISFQRETHVNELITAFFGFIFLKYSTLLMWVLKPNSKIHTVTIYWGEKNVLCWVNVWVCAFTHLSILNYTIGFLEFLLDNNIIHRDANLRLFSDQLIQRNPLYSCNIFICVLESTLMYCGYGISKIQVIKWTNRTQRANLEAYMLLYWILV